MKLIKLFGIYILLCVACMGRSDNVIVLDEATAKSWAAVKKRMSEPSETSVFPWVKNGKMLFQRVDSFHRDLCVYIYISKDGKCYYLQCELEELNTILANEIEKEDAMAFLNKEMVSFIAVVLSNPAMSSSLITEAVIRKSHADEKKTLKKYDLSGKNLSINKNKWTVNVNMIIQNGAIENWTATGTVDPLAINMFSKTLLEPRGTITGPVYMGLKIDPCRDVGFARRSGNSSAKHE
jgi:hypothetical protein